MRANRVRGHALLVLLLRRLRGLVASASCAGSAIGTVVVVLLDTAESSSAGPVGAAEGSSAFADVAARVGVAMGGTLREGLDLGVLVSRVRGGGGGDGGVGVGEGGEVERCVVEVLADRSGGTVGSWGVVRVGEVL